MSLAPHGASRQPHEVTAALVRVAIVFGVAALVALIARVTMGPPLF